MGRIFISYSRRDTETVDQVVDSMCNAGLEVWLDRHDIQAGNTWRVQIVQAIDTCDAFVLMLSPNSIASDNVRKEIDLAQDSGRTIFPFMLQPVKLPPEIRYQLAGLQFIDVQMLGFDNAISRLTSAIKGHMNKLKPVEEQKTCQAEIVIQGIDLKAFGAEKREQLLNFLAQLANTSRSGLMIANMAVGSVHVFIDMPAGSAYELKTLALNRDKRFKKFGIASLRLAGDSKFINISLGILTAAATIGFLQTIWLSMPSLLMPVVGVTVGKILTISVAVGVTTGLALSAPKAIAPLLDPTPSPILTSKVISAPISKPTLASTLVQTPELILVPIETPMLPVIPTATPQNQLVLESTVCLFGPHIDYGNVGSLKKGMRVELVGRACIGDCENFCTGSWWIVYHPDRQADCWVESQYLQIEPDINVQSLPAICPSYPKPNAPTATKPSVTKSSVSESPTATPCNMGDPSCYGLP